MSNPSAQLYQLLAESNTRSRECLRISKSAAGSIGSRQQQMQSEIEQLRQIIREQGLGTDLASEDRYLKLLRDFRSLHQSAELSRGLPDLSDLPVGDEALQKALDYGQMLLDIYGGGLLLKSAAGDITAHAERLRGWAHPKARRMADGLGKLRA